MDWASGRLSRGAAARFLRKSRAVFRSLFFSTKRKFSFLLILHPQHPHSALACMPLNFRRTTRLLDENRQGPEERLAHARKKHTVKLKGIEIKRPARRAATTFYFLRFIFSLRRPPRKRSYLSGGGACPFLSTSCCLDTPSLFSHQASPDNDPASSGDDCTSNESNTAKQGCGDGGIGGGGSAGTATAAKAVAKAKKLLLQQNQQQPEKGEAAQEEQQQQQQQQRHNNDGGSSGGSDRKSVV